MCILLQEGTQLLSRLCFSSQKKERLFKVPTIVPERESKVNVGSVIKDNNENLSEETITPEVTEL